MLYIKIKFKGWFDKMASSKLNVGGLTDFSTVDFPGKLASVLFLCGCPFRCPWCYNTELALSKNCFEISVDDIFEKIMSWRDMIDAVGVSGGEPTMQADALIKLFKKLRAEGLILKIDSDCFYPKNLEKIVPFLDYVAVDVKTSIDRPKEYAEITGFKGNQDELIEKVKECLVILKNSKKPVEVRTTVVVGMNDSVEIIKEIAKEIGFADSYVLQQFEPREGLLDKSFESKKIIPRNKMLELGKAAKEAGLKKVIVRTKENGSEEI